MKTNRNAPTVQAQRPRMIGGQEYWVQPLSVPVPGRPTPWLAPRGMAESIRTGRIAVHRQNDNGAPSGSEAA